MEFTSDTTDRLDKFLASKCVVSRGRVQRSIKDGFVKVNGKRISETDHKIFPNDLIDLPEFEDASMKPLDLDLKIVYENDNILVIDKPANLVVHPGAGHTDDTLSNALIFKYPDIAKVGDPARPGIVHRLDEDTSGLIVAAKTQSGFDYMKALFQTRDIEKDYITLVHGTPKMHEIINEPMERASTHVKMKVGSGKEAVTEYRIIATNQEFQGLDQMALLRVKLHTGRTHQIRVHMAHIGHPVVGDQLYGGNHKKADAQLINRQFLHATQLKFNLPDGTHVDLVSALPQDLQEVLKKVNIEYHASI